MRAPGRPSPAIAYGLAFGGPLLDESLCSMLACEQPGSAEPALASRWPQVSLAWERGDLGGAHETLGEDDALIRCLFGGHLVVNRLSGSARFVDPTRPGADVVAHPGLAGVGAIFARWLGRSAFHGGAVIAGDGAWGLVGAKGRGKSTALAALSVAGHPILADDLVVLESGQALSGPRTLDLRRSAAEHLQVESRTVSVRAGQRQRLTLGAVPAGVPLRGWICLEAGRSLGVERVPPGERPGLLAGHLAVRSVPRHPVALLDSASLPVYRLRHPSRWEELAGVVLAVEQIIASG